MGWVNYVFLFFVGALIIGAGYLGYKSQQAAGGSF